MNSRLFILGCSLIFGLGISCFLPAQTLFQHIERDSGLINLAPGISIPKENAGYTLVMPRSGQARGMIVFFNSDRDTINKMYRYANPKGIAVLYLSTGNPLEFLFETTAKQQLEGYIHLALEHHGIPKENLLFSGMSLAGTRAFKMAEFAQSKASKYKLKPRAIAACDAPLDFVRFWQALDKAKRIQFHPAAANEGTWVTAWLEKNLGGKPTDHLEAYISYSPYCYLDREGVHLSNYKNIAVRTYTEPDVQWWMKTRRKDYYAMNAIDAAAIVNELNIRGNSEAELVTTQDKGYWGDGTRHPHSWSIVDEAELVEWFLGILKI